MKELVAESLSGNITELGAYEEQFAELDTGEVRIYVDQELSETELCYIEGDILAQGVVLTDYIVQDGGVIVIKFRKELAPLVIIGIIAATGIGGIVGWQLFKDKITGWLAAPFGVPWWVWILGTGSVVALYFMTRGKEAVSGGQPIVQKFFLGKGEKK